MKKRGIDWILTIIMLVGMGIILLAVILTAIIGAHRYLLYAGIVGIFLSVVVAVYKICFMGSTEVSKKCNCNPKLPRKWMTPNEFCEEFGVELKGEMSVYILFRHPVDGDIWSLATVSYWLGDDCRKPCVVAGYDESPPVDWRPGMEIPKKFDN